MIDHDVNQAHKVHNTCENVRLFIEAMVPYFELVLF